MTEDIKPTCGNCKYHKAKEVRYTTHRCANPNLDGASIGHLLDIHTTCIYHKYAGAWGEGEEMILV